jgi:hypothetical protein
MVGSQFVAEIVLKEVVRGLTSALVCKVFRSSGGRGGYNRPYPVRTRPYNVQPDYREVRHNTRTEETDHVKTNNMKEKIILQGNMSPFEFELGDALSLYSRRCNLYDTCGKDACCYSYRDALFSLASTLKDIEPYAGHRHEEISKLLEYIETALLGEDSAAEGAAMYLSRMLLGDKAA